VKSRPAGIDDSDVLHALAEGWGIVATSAEHVAVGFGSHHWVVVDEAGKRFFVTVDELGSKAWLGDTCDVVFAGLRKAFDTAVVLRDKAGLGFVLAPLPAVSGESVRRVGQCHSVAVFPFVDGEAGDFGDRPGPEQRAEMVRLLVQLHQATPAVPRGQPLALGFADRAGLEAAMHDVNYVWEAATDASSDRPGNAGGGPYAEPARAWRARHVGDLGRALDDFDHVVRAVAAAQVPPVITHGEPHPGNVMRSLDGLLLIDWDTVALAPPERDLWLLATDSGEEAALYRDATGHEVSSDALSLYRRAWDLADIAAYIDQFRSPHHRTADTEAAWTNLENSIRRGNH
jgi:spectinomycin phosphotransferase